MGEWDKLKYMAKTKVKLPKNFGRMTDINILLTDCWLAGYRCGTRDCVGDYECGLRKVSKKLRKKK